MGLFDKKTCDICGGKIGLLGNRKLSDGSICKDCAAKLSPFFSERKQSTVAQIREQLAYREANQAAVAAFRVTRVFDGSKMLFIDEEAGNFLVNRRENYKQDNPDVIPLSAVTGVFTDVTDNRTEIKRKGADDKEVSFVPPHYETTFDVYLVIHVNSPWFDEIRYEISDEIVVPTIGHAAADPNRNFQYVQAMQKAFDIRAALLGEEPQVYGMPQTEQGQTTINVTVNIGSAPAEPREILCPHCGRMTATGTGYCQYCGGPLNLK